MPNSQALQVFYGSIPLIVVLAGIYFREQLLLKDILKRLSNLEVGLTAIKDWMIKVEHRLTTLETRAGVIYHE
jgi:hypothetical protein